MIDELKNEANKILDSTANEQEEYANERKLLFSIMENINDDNDELLYLMLKVFKNMIKLEKQNKEYTQLKESIGKFTKQQIRKSDLENYEKLHLFKIEDKNKEQYTFFTRENAKNFIQKYKDNFDDTDIKIVKNTNMDLEEIIDSIQ